MNRIKEIKIAIVSYNKFLPGKKNGWHKKDDRSVLLIQGDVEWGIGKDVMSPGGGFAGANECRTKINSLCENLIDEIPNLDKIIFYVGSYGAEHSIKLAAQNHLNPSCAIFVMCDCNQRVKEDMIESCGFFSSGVLDCECGGNATMSRIFYEFLKKGTIERRHLYPTN